MGAALRRARPGQAATASANVGVTTIGALAFKLWLLPGKPARGPRVTRERYSWTEDALGATRAVQRARAMTASCTTSRGSIFDHVLCFAVGGLGLLLLYVALAEPPSTWSGLIAGLVLVSLSVIAALQHWGPMIPCMAYVSP